MNTNKRMVAVRFEYSCRIRGWPSAAESAALLPAVLDKAFRGELGENTLTVFDIVLSFHPY